MQKRHSDRKMYFDEQVYTTGRHVLPFIEGVMPLKEGLKVLEVGCGEGGNLVPFLERGCKVTGVDLSAAKIEAAEKLFSGHSARRNIKLLAMDIYDAAGELDGPYDLIYMRDVIEHIYDQDRFMGYIKQFLKPEGLFFLAFPPWYNPFGGHQQICRNRVLSKLPYFHLLPAALYKGILKSGGETDRRIQELLEIKETGISIERFQKIIRKNGYTVRKKDFYVINPNYEIKFGLKPRKQSRIVNVIPFLNNFITTSVYFILKKNY